MTGKERVSSLHERMDRRRRTKERRKTAAIGCAAAILATGLLVLIFGGPARIGGASGEYSGSMMLFDHVGGYVLVGIISFTAAVIITVISMRWKKKQNDRQDQEKEGNREEDTHED